MPSLRQAVFARQRMKRRVKYERERCAEREYRIADAGIDWVTIMWRLPHLTPYDVSADSDAVRLLTKLLAPYEAKYKRIDREADGHRCPVNWCTADGGWALGMYHHGGQVYARAQIRGCLTSGLDPLTLYSALLDAFKSARIPIEGEKIQRLDLAVDVDGNHRREIVRDIGNKFYRGQLRVSKQTTDPPNHGRGWTQYVGSGDIKFCIYNKSEQKKKKKKKKKTRGTMRLSQRREPPTTRFEVRLLSAALRHYEVRTVPDLQDRDVIRHMMTSVTTRKFCIIKTKSDHRRARTEPTALWRAASRGLKSCFLTTKTTGQLPVVPHATLTEKDDRSAMAQLRGMMRYAVMIKCEVYDYMTEREARDNILEQMYAETECLPSRFSK